MSAVHSQNWAGLQWSAWIPLNAPLVQYRQMVTTAPGLYRVRAVNEQGLVYIGQTGRNLRERTRALATHTHRPADNPPWNDPHTAAPGLWCWHHESCLHYEVSVAPVRCETSERQCLEDSLLLRHRITTGVSTLCNHGRFHPAWTRPSNKKGGRRMQRLPAGQINPASEPSAPPIALHGNPAARDWLKLPWQPWCSMSTARSSAPERAGVYRLRDGGQVVYLGESSDLHKRLGSHARRFPHVHVSWLEMPNALKHQLHERETDLIGAFYITQKRAPKHQYCR